MKIPIEFADGKTDLAPLIWELMTRGEFEDIEGCVPVPHLREAVALCIIQNIPLTMKLHPNDPWPERKPGRAQS